MRPVTVAAAVGRDTNAIRSFERGQTWPRSFDQFLARYAEAVGVKPDDIWKRAIDLYLAS